MHPVLPWLLAMFMAWAVYGDIRERRIPNLAVLSGLIVALVLNALTAGVPGLASFFIGTLTGLAVLLPLYALRLMGAGDAKLMAMAGGFAGSAQAVLWMALYTFLAGGVLVILYATFTRAWGKLFSNLFIMMTLGPSELDARGSGDKDKLQPAARLPYAVAIACGSIGYLLFGAP